MLNEILEKVKKILNSIEIEYSDFKINILALKPYEVYENYHKIYVYENLHDFFASCKDTKDYDELILKLDNDKGSILSLLYDFYLKDEYASLTCFEDIIDMIEYYVSKRK